MVRREALVQAVNAAVFFSKEHDGKLVAKQELKSAIDKYRNTLKSAGLTGKLAPHSLRYAYSQEATELYIKQGSVLRKLKQWYQPI